MSDPTSYIGVYVSLSYLVVLLLPIPCLVFLRHHECIRKRRIAETITLCTMSSVIGAIELYPMFYIRQSPLELVVQHMIYTVIEPLSFIITLMRAYILAHEHYCNMITTGYTDCKNGYFTKIEAAVFKMVGFRMKSVYVRGTHAMVFNFATREKHYVLIKIASFLLVFAFIVISTIYALNWQEPTTIENHFDIYSNIYNGIALIYAILAVIILIRLKQIKIPYAIYEEHLLIAPVVFIGAPLIIGYKFIPNAHTRLKYKCITAAACFATPTVIFYFFPLVLLWYLKRRTSDLKVTMESLNLVIESPTMWPVLRDQLARDFAIENALFLDDYTELKSLWTERAQRDKELKSAAARRYAQKMEQMWRLYFESESPYELNISHRALCELRSKCQIGSRIYFTPGDLAPIRKAVLDLILQNSYPRFLVSCRRLTQGNTILNAVYDETCV